MIRDSGFGIQDSQANHGVNYPHFAACEQWASAVLAPSLAGRIRGD
jgi:hypothetical protein